jgi:hypothetical protein
MHVFFGKFLLGQVIATPGVMEKVNEDDRISALTRHINGDWGEWVKYFLKKRFILSNIT